VYSTGLGLGLQLANGLAVAIHHARGAQHPPTHPAHASCDPAGRMWGPVGVLPAPGGVPLMAQHVTVAGQQLALVVPSDIFKAMECYLLRGMPAHAHPCPRRQAAATDASRTQAAALACAKQGCVGHCTTKSRCPRWPPNYRVARVYGCCCCCCCCCCRFCCCCFCCCCCCWRRRHACSSSAHLTATA
jgi:hypothetical protein